MNGQLRKLPLDVTFTSITVFEEFREWILIRRGEDRPGAKKRKDGLSFLLLGKEDNLRLCLLAERLAIPQLYKWALHQYISIQKMSNRDMPTELALEVYGQTAPSSPLRAFVATVLACQITHQGNTTADTVLYVLELHSCPQLITDIFNSIRSLMPGTMRAPHHHHHLAPFFLTHDIAEVLLAEGVNSGHDIRCKCQPKNLKKGVPFPTSLNARDVHNTGIPKTEAWRQVVQANSKNPQLVSGIVKTGYKSPPSTFMFASDTTRSEASKTTKSISFPNDIIDNKAKLATTIKTPERKPCTTGKRRKGRRRHPVPPLAKADEEYSPPPTSMFSFHVNDPKWNAQHSKGKMPSTGAGVLGWEKKVMDIEEWLHNSRMGEQGMEMDMDLATERERLIEEDGMEGFEVEVKCGGKKGGKGKGKRKRNIQGDAGDGNVSESGGDADVEDMEDLGEENEMGAPGPRAECSRILGPRDGVKREDDGEEINRSSTIKMDEKKKRRIDDRRARRADREKEKGVVGGRRRRNWKRKGVRDDEVEVENGNKKGSICSGDTAQVARRSGEATKGTKRKFGESRHRDGDGDGDRDGDGIGEEKGFDDDGTSGAEGVDGGEEEQGEGGRRRRSRGRSSQRRKVLAGT
ncbi:hypothetical protein MMC24_004066 [Lignoscripta atroalba]|nr:hypothetical protein [Lignoscripta atroalba]